MQVCALLPKNNNIAFKCIGKSGANSQAITTISMEDTFDKFNKTGFDTKVRRPELKLCDLLKSEVDELKQAIKNKDKTNTIEESGDIFFLIHRIASLTGTNLNAALNVTIQKNNLRLNRSEELSKKVYNKPLIELSQKQRIRIWQKAKSELKDETNRLLDSVV